MNNKKKPNDFTRKFIELPNERYINSENGFV